jgi:predicted nucleic acid-binding protein
MNKVVISDTSCFIAFDRINKLEILQLVFGTVLTTPRVMQEFGKNLPAWITLKEATNQDKLIELEGILDKGEASAIALALEIPGALIIIDEKKGRKIAKSLDLEVIGSLKVLLIAKQKGIIRAIHPIIQELESKNFRFSNELLEQALLEAGETM